MLVLGIESASRAGSVALLGTADEAAGEGAPVLLAEATFGETGAAGAEILPALGTCLEQTGKAFADLDLIAVSIGPGSFTGLRVGLATAQGLALGTGAALVGVATLDALAAAACSVRGPLAPSDLLCPCLDARRGEVYAALYRGAASWPGVTRVTDDAAHAPADLAERVRSTRGVAAVVFAGDGAERHRDALVAPLGTGVEILSSAVLPPRAGLVARLGHERYLREGADDPGKIVPRYARAPEAEIQRRRASATPRSG